MKKAFFLFFLVIFFSSCNKNTQVSHNEWVKISEQLKFKKHPNEIEIESGKHKIKIEKNQLPLKKIILLNASLVGYFNEINAISSITGVASPEYISNQKIHEGIANGTIKTIGNEQKYNIELILSEKPDAIITNYFASFESTYKILQNNGIKIIFLDEYKENLPLEKAAYLKLFGVLLGKEKEANLAYQNIENKYLSLVELAKKAPTKPMVIANSLYGNQWFMPSGSSYVANLFRDANTDFPWSENKKETSLALSFEEVLLKSQKASFWVNIGTFRSKNELLQSNFNYKKLNCFEKGKLFTYYKRSKDLKNDYFETGVVRVDWILEDYVKIFHPEMFPKNTETIFMNEIKDIK